MRLRNGAFRRAAVALSMTEGHLSLTSISSLAVALQADEIVKSIGGTTAESLRQHAHPDCRGAQIRAIEFLPGLEPAK